VQNAQIWTASIATGIESTPTQNGGDVRDWHQGEPCCVTGERWMGCMVGISETARSDQSPMDTGQADGAPTPASGTRTRGRDASGLGYPSGHAGMAVALGTAVFLRLSPSGRAAVVAAVPIVGLSRVYVGAHLRLDIADGAALGLAAVAAVALVRHPGGHENQPDARRFAPSRCTPARTPTGGPALTDKARQGGRG
jgi:hypothetical protein